MRKILLILLLIPVVFSSCEKKELETGTPKTYNNKIELEPLNVFKDSVRLNWSKLDTTAFVEYWIIRSEGDFVPEFQNIHYNPYNPYPNLLHRITDPNVTSFVDKNLPFTPVLEYYVVGMLSGQQTASGRPHILSNSQKFSRPEIKALEIQPFDVLHNKDDKLLYLLESASGEISLYNYEKDELITTIHSNATIGYSDIGTYNQKKEIYVPRNDGWVFIYDASNLNRIEQVAVGSPASSLVYNNNKLFVSTSERAWNSGPIKVINRQTKALVSEGGDYEQTRLKLIPGSNSEMIEITIYVGPVNLSYFKFDQNGNYVSGHPDRYHGDYPLDHKVFEIFPNGQQFITSSQGAIYDKSLTYKTRLPHGNFEFTDFAFDPVKNLVYCGTNSKSVEVYSLSDYSLVKSIATKGYPLHLFVNEGKLISVSKTMATSQYKVVVEKIDL